ncbi:MAG TPA: hypothetical protein VES89_03280 [Candidatus Competibacteraceae bacterium]|nr:hypothetical protein [Candidatus Competibacteraceae bacterium]
MPSSSLIDRIQTLDDATARRVLTTFARAQSPQATPELTPAFVQALRDFAPEPAPGQATAGDAARTALLLLAQDPRQQAILTALIDGPAPERLGVLETTALVSAVLIALQTHLKFERDKDGHWTIKIEKKPTDATLLKTLIQKLLSLMNVE